MRVKPIALVTAANKGIGLQIARDLATHGLTVLVGSRKLEHAETAAKSIGADARAVQLDVTNQASIAAAAKRIRNEFGRLDVLVNNAGTSDAGKQGISHAAPLEGSAVFETNVFGVVAVTQAMLRLLGEAPAARIVSVDPSSPQRALFGPVYSPSETALDATTLAFAIEFEDAGADAACPGFTSTNLDSFEGTAERAA
ncbi:SDR family NAD(P)-dependent oxidoreductase [Mesorhizobium muleiense]|uniref:NADP-dependent 3-hydroxy acid dehydrogenase YdfG n=1 Tax=Mesorhizobium muleiense TaxID=1004279 RepID=A0A1G9E9A8_9HYPH|nr:SDR family NAD(P)-dependent oxidoreductase [Mesorhizobium muleiense]MCF6103912.1 SDR family NAD(P)-dependent oxidoreductase [Mesorhizobium muleiense]SDK72720.1 NADP-dependent 3-hydroxy acid dehydrogenase YdfG [Mesorhizobium muleiense]